MNDGMEDKKSLKKSRVMGYFVAAATEIIEEFGLDAVTIRLVAERAGYHSSTIYNYFDDLDHVMFMGCMDYLDRYNRELTKKLAGVQEPISFYFKTVEIFNHYAYHNPKVFWMLFYGCTEEKRVQYTKQYYETMSPEQKLEHELISQASIINDLFLRHEIFLGPIVAAGYMPPEGSEMQNELSLMVTKFVLGKIISDNLSPEEAAATTMKYYRHCLRSFLYPEYQHLV